MNIKNTLFWIASILFAFSVGYFSKTSHQVQSSNKSSQAKISQLKSEEQDNTEVSVINLKNNDAHHETINESGASTDSKSIMAKVKVLLGKSPFMMDLSSIAKSYTLIQNFSEQDVNEALNDLQGSLSKAENAMVVQLLIGRYAEITPYGAIDFIENNIQSSNKKQQYLSSAITVWAKKDPSSAYYWAKENDQEQSDFMSSYKYVSIFNGLAKQDINDAFSKLNEMTDKGQSTNMAAMGVANGLENSEQFTEFYQN